MKKIAIVGAGISGISAGKMLSENYDVTVFEKERSIGGLIKCERVNDNLFHKVGGHVFNSKNEEVRNWFWKHFDRDKEFIKVKRKAGILLDGKFLGYPIENYIYQLDKGLQKNIVEDLLEINRRGYAESLDEYNNFESFLIQRFGKTLYELYFKPYNYKIWNFDLSKVPLPWLEGKLPMPDVKSIMLSNIQREEEQEMVHSFFYYPVTGGSQFIIDRLAEGLKILKGTTVFNIEPSGQEWLINKEQKFDIVIYCGDIRSLGSILKTEDSNISGLLNEVPKFKSNGTSNIFCETDVMDYTWLYLPEANLKAHRIIYTGNLSDDNNRGSQRKTCVVEFSGKVAYENMCQEIKKLPGNLSPLSYNYEPNSYIIHESDNRKKVNSLSSFLESKNIFLAGRFAEWEYYNMDKCIESVIRIKNLHL